MLRKLDALEVGLYCGSRAVGSVCAEPMVVLVLVSLVDRDMDLRMVVVSSSVLDGIIDVLEAIPLIAEIPSFILQFLVNQPFKLLIDIKRDITFGFGRRSGLLNRKSAFAFGGRGAGGFLGPAYLPGRLLSSGRRFRSSLRADTRGPAGWFRNAAPVSLYYPRIIAKIYALFRHVHNSQVTVECSLVRYTKAAKPHQGNRKERFVLMLRFGGTMKQ